MIKLVLDAMGGDHAPRAILDGAMQSVEKGIVAPAQVHLAGPVELLREQLRLAGLPPDHFPIVDAPDVLSGDESPVEAIRRKPRNSIAIGIGMLKDKQADAFVSAGSTGGVVATATVGLRCLENIRRPGIAVTIEGEGGPFVVIDVGANPQPKALHLLHYALMGSAYYRDCFGKDRPRVGLVNIGSEEAKGNPLVREARAMLKASEAIEFVGNIEGVDVFSGKCDVIVCDGFTGNVLLKVSEGVAEYMLRTMVRFMDESEVTADKRRTIVGKLQKRVDYSEYGGALLLGVEGIVTICHGRSQGPAICNAIRFASKAVGAKVNQHIVAAAKATPAAS